MKQPQRPDRVEQVAVDKFGVPVDIPRLLRRERARLRRKVKGLRWCRPISIRLQGYNDAINDVLKVLED